MSEKTRRKAGTGSVQRKRSGAGYMYYAVVANGRKRTWHKAGPRPEDAEKLLEKLLAAREEARQLEARRTPPATEGLKRRTLLETLNHELEADPLFADYATAWLAKHAVGASAESHKDGARQTVENVLIPCFGMRRLSQLEAADGWSLVLARIDGSAPIRRYDADGRPTRVQAQVKLPTALNNLSVLSKMLADAKELIGPNPMLGLKKVIQNAIKYEAPVRAKLNRRQVEALVEATPLEHRPLMRVLVELGLRLGEALALRWSDYDEETGYLEVEYSWSHAKLGPTKTRAGKRTLRLSPKFRDLLAEHRARQLASGNENRFGLIFPGPAGGYMDAGNWRKTVFYKVVAAANLTLRGDAKIVPHSLRHTFATLQLRNGRPVGQVRAIMGHAGEGFTADWYGRSAAHEYEGYADDF